MENTNAKIFVDTCDLNYQELLKRRIEEVQSCMTAQ